MNNNSKTAKEIYEIWAAQLRKDIEIRYKYKHRKEHIDNLMVSIKEHNIEETDTRMLRKDVVRALITEEGLKGKNHYKNWKENIEQDFNDAVLLLYNEPLPKLNVSNQSYSKDPNIMLWAKHKFGEDVSEEILRSAHQPMHALNIMFINEFFKRKVKGVQYGMD